MSLLVGASVAAAVLALRGPRGRSVTAVSTPPSARGDPPGGRRTASRGWRTVRGRASSTRPELPVVVAEVAARLRAGADPVAAWRAVLGDHVPSGGPTAADLAPRGGDDRRQAAVVVAACRVAAELGAPLAPMLDRVGEQLAATAEADGDRRAALAGPRATARVLTWLPALGVLLGAAVGADPLTVLLDGGLGSTALVTGVALLGAGRAWTRVLARRAVVAGRPT